MAVNSTDDRLRPNRLVVIGNHRDLFVRVHPRVQIVLHEGLEAVHTEGVDGLGELVTEGRQDRRSAQRHLLLLELRRDLVHADRRLLVGDVDSNSDRHVERATVVVRLADNASHFLVAVVVDVVRPLNGNVHVLGEQSLRSPTPVL